MEEFKDGDKVFIRWGGGSSGEYILAKTTRKTGLVSWHVYMNRGGELVVNYDAGEVFVDTESVELVE